MRRAAGTAVAALLLVAACSTPEPNRGAADRGDQPSTTGAPTAPEGAGQAGARVDATLEGRILGPDGTPLAGVPVTVVENRRTFGLDAALAAVFTVGMACVAVPDLCSGGERVADSATTDAEGRYELTLPQAHLPGYETDEDWVLSVGRAPAAGERSGPSSSYELEVNTARQEAPDLVLWDGTPAISADGPLLRVALPRLQAGPELDGDVARFVDDGGGVLWLATGETVDARVLEDRTTVLLSTGSADVTVRHADGRTIYHQQVATASVPYVGGLVPLSRGKPCVLPGGGNVGCPLTDADLHTATELGSDQPVTVDLGTPAEVGLVVVRGIGSTGPGDLVVEHSADGATWSRLPQRDLSGAEGWSAGPEPGTGIPSVRYLRISGAGALAEVSAWAPTDAERTAALPPSERPGADDGEGDDVPWGLGLVAAALVVATAAGVGRTLRRRGPT